MENIIYLAWDIGYRVDISYDRKLEDFLAAVPDDSEHRTMIRVEKLLVEKKSNIEDNQAVGTFLNVGNYL